MLIARIRCFALVAGAAAIGAVVAPTAGAQQISPVPGSAAQLQSAPAGPTLDRAAAGVRPLSQQPASAEDAEAAMQARLGLGQARALMVVGFAAVIIGLIVGDDGGTLIAIGGAAVGLYGLYHYLK